MKLCSVLLWMEEGRLTKLEWKTLFVLPVIGGGRQDDIDTSHPSVIEKGSPIEAIDKLIIIVFCYLVLVRWFQLNQCSYPFVFCWQSILLWTSNGNIYFSKFHNVFVEIAKRICVHLCLEPNHSLGKAGHTSWNQPQKRSYISETLDYETGFLIHLWGC